MSTYRRLVLPSGTWRWRYGRPLVILAPNGTKHLTDHSKMTGLSWFAIEKGHRKRSSDGTIAPSQVRAYIERTLLPQRASTDASSARNGSRVAHPIPNLTRAKTRHSTRHHVGFRPTPGSFRHPAFPRRNP